MSLAENLLALYPGANPTRDFMVQDDGNGPYLAYWNEGTLGPRPDTDNLPAPVTPTPTEVTPRQARLALHSAGLLDQVQAAVDAAGGATKISWEYSTIIERNSPLITSIGGSLGLTPEQIDVLFKYAATQ